jgi:hypothetical protein
MDNSIETVSKLFGEISGDASASMLVEAGI